MKSEQIIHSLAVGIKSIQSRVIDRETDEVISFVKIPIADSGLVRCEKGTREMNNEPVAWMIKTLDGRSLMLYGEEQPPKFKEDVQYIPLYTHPHPDNLVLAESIIKQQKLEIDALHNLVKEQDKKIINLAFEKVYAERSAEVLSELYNHPVKDLEDIDINITWNENSMRDFGKDELNFARAILKKAQEK